MLEQQETCKRGAGTIKMTIDKLNQSKKETANSPTIRNNLNKHGTKQTT